MIHSTMTSIKNLSKIKDENFSDFYSTKPNLQKRPPTHQCHSVRPNPGDFHLFCPKQSDKANRSSKKFIQFIHISQSSIFHLIFPLHPFTSLISKCPPAIKIFSSRSTSQGACANTPNCPNARSPLPGVHLLPGALVGHVGVGDIPGHLLGTRSSSSPGVVEDDPWRYGV